MKICEIKKAPMKLFSGDKDGTNFKMF